MRTRQQRDVLCESILSCHADYFFTFLEKQYLTPAFYFAIDNTTAESDSGDSNQVSGIRKSLFLERSVPRATRSLSLPRRTRAAEQFVIAKNRDDAKTIRLYEEPQGDEAIQLSGASAPHVIPTI